MDLPNFIPTIDRILKDDLLQTLQESEEEVAAQIKVEDAGTSTQAALVRRLAQRKLLAKMISEKGRLLTVDELDHTLRSFDQLTAGFHLVSIQGRPAPRASQLDLLKGA